MRVEIPGRLPVRVPVAAQVDGDDAEASARAAPPAGGSAAAWLETPCRQTTGGRARLAPLDDGAASLASISSPCPDGR